MPGTCPLNKKGPHTVISCAGLPEPGTQESCSQVRQVELYTWDRTATCRLGAVPPCCHGAEYPTSRGGQEGLPRGGSLEGPAGPGTQKAVKKHG